MVPSTQPLNGTAHRFVRVDDARGLPVTVKILLEGVTRVDGDSERKAAEALARYPRDNAAIPFRPSRILLQDYTGNDGYGQILGALGDGWRQFPHGYDIPSAGAVASLIYTFRPNLVLETMWGITRGHQMNTPTQTSH